MYPERKWLMMRIKPHRNLHWFYKHFLWCFLFNLSVSRWCVLEITNQNGFFLTFPSDTALSSERFKSSYSAWNKPPHFNTLQPNLKKSLHFPTLLSFTYLVSPVAVVHASNTPMPHRPPICMLVFHYAIITVWKGPVKNTLHSSESQ